MKDHKVYLTDSKDTKCYLCLETIDYYYKFNCGCYNFYHTECVRHNNFEKCLICKKKIAHIMNIIPDSEFFDLTLSEKFFEFLKINKNFQTFLILLKIYPNILTFIIFLTINIGICIGLIIPIIFINITFNFIKKFYKIFDLIFSITIIYFLTILYFNLFVNVDLYVLSTILFGTFLFFKLVVLF
jgi:hypothetical protein